MEEAVLKKTGRKAEEIDWPAFLDSRPSQRENKPKKSDRYMIRNNTMEEKEEELKSPADSIRERALSFCVRASLRAMREWCWGQDSRRSAGWAYVSVKTRRQHGKRTAAVEKHYAESVDGPSRMISSPAAHRFLQLLNH